MGNQSETTNIVPPNSISELATRGGVALVFAVAGNILFVTLANALGVSSGFEAYDPLIASRGTAVSVVGATVVYALLARFSERPNRIFTVVAAIVYLLGLIPVVVRAPGMPGATTLGVALLPVMHAIVAVPCVLLLTGRLSWR